MDFLEGIALKNYRGIGQEFVLAANMSRFNYFLGENNSGKSTFLNFVSTYLPNIGQSREGLSLGSLDRNLTGGQVEVLTPNAADSLYERVVEKIRNRHVSSDHSLRGILDSLALEGYIWAHWKEPFAKPEGLWAPDGEAIILNVLPRHADVQRLWTALTGQSGGGLHEHWIPGILNSILTSFQPPNRKVKLIPAKRQLGQAGEKFDDFSGSGLIDELARLQNPDIGQRENKIKFEKINIFVQRVLDVNQSRIEIPHDRNRVLVHNNGRVLPINSLGTGIHELILLAAFCTIAENTIVCIEEPENHLHPNLQKALIRYLDSETKNQYIIASHSNSFLTSDDCSVYHVSLKDNHTSVRKAISPSEKHLICYDLGYLPSDILQSNCCIWVEGPSDRVYLNHWIWAKAPDLIEGLHYSIMFYGGRLLSHLSASDDDLADFIALRRLNRHSAIVIDSDKSSARGKINDTKSRLISEFSERPGFSWLTKGREVENYIRTDLIEEAIKSIHSKSFGKMNGTGQFDNLLNFKKKRSSDSKTADKIGVARFVAKRPADFSILDLNMRIEELTAFIRAAN